MATLYHQVWIDAPIGTVYDALASAEGLSGWWAPHTATHTDAGVVLAHDPGEPHGPVRFLVRAAVHPRRLEWQVISSHPPQSPASAWTGTRVAFDLGERPNPGVWRGIPSERPSLTVLEFRHTGWDEASEYFGFCNFAWAQVLTLLQRHCEAR
jgi:uncharacterized protein YndB with AHSA1/START domain